MQITVDVPDEFLSRIASEPSDLPKRALEDIGIEMYRSSRLTHRELQVFLDLPSRFEVDTLLKSRNVQEGAYSLDDWIEDGKTVEAVFDKKSA